MLDLFGVIFEVLRSKLLCSDGFLDLYFSGYLSSAKRPIEPHASVKLDLLGMGVVIGNQYRGL